MCGARYKTRQGLSYHLSHTHKGGRANSGGGRSRGGGNSNNNTPSAHPRADPASYQPQAFQTDALAGLAEFQDSYLGYLSAGQDASPTGMPSPPCLRPCLCLLPHAPSLNACCYVSEVDHSITLSFSRQVAKYSCSEAETVRVVCVMLGLLLGYGQSWGLLEQVLSFVCCAVKAFLIRSFVVSTHPPLLLLTPYAGVLPCSTSQCCLAGSEECVRSVRMSKVWWLFFSTLDQNSKHLLLWWEIWLKALVGIFIMLMCANKYGFICLNWDIILFNWHFLWFWILLVCFVECHILRNIFSVFLYIILLSNKTFKYSFSLIFSQKMCDSENQQIGQVNSLGTLLYTTRMKMRRKLLDMPIVAQKHVLCFYQMFQISMID